MLSNNEILPKMSEVFGYSGFKNSEQGDSVRAVLRGDKNIIVSMATNAGKSLCFQLPSALQQPNRCKVVLVIVPTLSLLENQMRFLNKLYMNAKSINSLESYESRDAIKEELLSKNNTIKFLYMCPEMVQLQDYFLDKLFLQKKISHVVIDEAQCVIDNDFRPSYGVLQTMRMENENVPFIALTTASPETINAIADELGMPESKTIIEGSSIRKNIFYDAVELPESNILEFIRTFTPDFEKLKPKEMPSGIIFCTSVKEVKNILEMLEVFNILATSFYAKLEQRFENYDNWMSNAVPVMVATTESFGLGIFKDDVKFVIHVGAPKNLRAYYQESGRAGASGDRAFSRIYYGKRIWNDEQVEEFCLTKKCRVQYLANNFGESVKPCLTNCDNCKSTE